MREQLWCGETEGCDPRNDCLRVVLASLGSRESQEKREDPAELMESGKLCPRLLGFGKAVIPRWNSFHSP